ncbi:MAG: sensor histidine kinase [Dermatophilaceae bacterium]
MSTTVHSSSVEFAAMWRRQQPLWHVFYAVIWAAAVYVLVVEADESPRPLAVAVLVAMGTAYLAFGVRGLMGDLRFATAYHLLSWACLLLLQVMNADAPTWVLFWILFPHVWAMFEKQVAVPMTLIVVVAVNLLRWWQMQFAPEELPGVVFSAAVSAALSLAPGLFIDHMVREAETRAHTIDELRATQARLAAVEHDRGVQTERERMSREIHDTLAQGYTSVVTLSRAVDAALARGDVDAARERLRLIEGTAIDNLHEARLIVAELTPSHLQSRTLVEALERLAAAVSRENGVRAEVSVAGEPAPLGGASEVVILRTAQEALSNVRRHAGAERVGLSLAYDDPRRVVLTVADDGCGFDPSGGRRGFGLDGVEARVRIVGGTVALDAAPGRGTTLRLEVPR